MDVLESHLDNESQDENSKENDLTENDDQDGSSLSMDQYQFRSDGPSGQTVTYRVVQVAGGDEQGLIATSLPPGTQVAQAVLQGSFGGGGSVSPSGDGTLTYIPASSVTASGDSVVTEAVLTSQVAAGGQFYVMMSPQDVLQSQRSLAPRSLTVGHAKDVRVNRDERRRATHNEVERRRRDKINNWIVTLSKLIPDCSPESTKQGSITSKGGILSKACDYIQELRNANVRMSESLKEVERYQTDMDIMRQQLEQAKEEIALLRRVLEQSGVESDMSPTDQ